MPLRKPGVSVAEKPLENVAGSQVTELSVPCDVVSAPTATSKATSKQAAPRGTKLDKEGYWERKEERDIETGKRIRRSGVFQAALQSMAALQFNQGGTIESYLEVVKKMADEGLKWIEKD